MSAISRGSAPSSGIRAGSIVGRHGKGGKRRDVRADEWASEHVEPWRQHRLEISVGPYLCITDGATRGRVWSQTGARRIATARRVGGRPPASRRINCATRTRSR
jgi:hypothetical protein